MNTRRIMLLTCMCAPFILIGLLLYSILSGKATSHSIGESIFACTVMFIAIAAYGKQAFKSTRG